MYKVNQQLLLGLCLWVCRCGVAVCVTTIMASMMDGFLEYLVAVIQPHHRVTRLPEVSAENVKRAQKVGYVTHP